MAYLSDAQIAELSSDDLIESKVFIERGGSMVSYTLKENGKHGMKGVVWKAKDDLGIDVAIKIMLNEEYRGRSLMDEMSDAQKLSSDYFAGIKFFGKLKIESRSLSTEYCAIASEWIVGQSFQEFIDKSLYSVERFLLIVRNLFTALADLRANELCHDDLHSGNILIEVAKDTLTREDVVRARIIDSGTIKSIKTREALLDSLRADINTLENAGAPPGKVSRLKEFLRWKEPDDHLRVVDCLLKSANALLRMYSRLDYWERKFLDGVLGIFQRLADPDLTRRLDDPKQIIQIFEDLRQKCMLEGKDHTYAMRSPFDYISAEMIRNDREFAGLFSREFPWLADCTTIQPLYIYGPRGSGKSSVLRWLAFKTRMSDPAGEGYEDLKDVGIYVSCSVELRSRFWLLSQEALERAQIQTIRFFNLLLVEELLDTLALMLEEQEEDKFNFGFTQSAQHSFTEWVKKRLILDEGQIRLQGQGYFEYLRSMVRKLRWDTWASIRAGRSESGNVDPSLAMDICRELPQYFEYFKSRSVVFLVDDYSNQRIPKALQKVLNQTISFAKQGNPIFKVSSEYGGVDLEGIQEGREVVEINIGEKYINLADKQGSRFLTDIVNIRLSKAKPKYVSTIEEIIGPTSYEKIQDALATEDAKATPFYYHGMECIHYLCSGDVALALNVIRKIFDAGNVSSDTREKVPEKKQHETIQQYAHDEIRRVKNIVPNGEKMHDIVCWLGLIARVFVRNKKSARKDKPDEPVCKTHIDIRLPVLTELEDEEPELALLYSLLTSRSILVSLQTSRSRIVGATERLQLRRIYLPAFKAPFKRDVPIKIDTLDELKSLLSDPKRFAERELKKSSIGVEQLKIALQEAREKPMESAI